MKLNNKINMLSETRGRGIACHSAGVKSNSFRLLGCTPTVVSGVFFLY